MESVIMGVKLSRRIEDAANFQNVLTKNGCIIKTRLGLHEASSNDCSPSGIIILQLSGTPIEIENLEKELLAIEGVKVEKMYL